VKRMSFRQEVECEGRFREKRRGVRLNSRAPVAIEWKESNGGARRVEAHTRVVGPYGCLLVFPHNLEVEQHVQLTNLANGQSAPAVVVWKGSEQAEGWEIGIELIGPEMDFWGLDL
jgi:hypothetical protein